MLGNGTNGFSVSPLRPLLRRLRWLWLEENPATVRGGGLVGIAQRLLVAAITGPIRGRVPAKL